MAAFTQQKLDWRACDEAFLGTEMWQKQGADFEPLGQRVQCALMRAPLDYAHPASGELQVALSRAMAQQPQQRLGAIFFNPGGPGVDGLALSAIFAGRWSEVQPGEPASEQFKQMSDRYDLIGFSPRGVGAATQLDCGAPVVPGIGSYSYYDSSRENQLALQNTVRLQAQACSANPLSKHIHTDAIARDMDLMRALLGDEKLNYIGYSYGTRLGAWYASLFPERVGRMLLDSSAYVLGTADEISLLQAMGKDRLVNEIFLPYATRHPLTFNLGESITGLRSALMALLPKLKALLFSDGNNAGRAEAIDWNNSQSIDASLVYMNAALGLQTLLEQQPAPDEGQIRSAITAHRFAPDTAINQLAVVYAQQLTTELFKEPDHSARKFPVEIAVRWSVACNDSRTSADAQQAIGAPLTDEALAGHICAYWPKSGIQRPPLTMAQRAGPILMLQSRYDALTPIEGAQATLDALPNASMIVVENEFRHAVFPYGDECVDGQVTRYFLQGTMPQRLSSCAGKPLRFDVSNGASPR